MQKIEVLLPNKPSDDRDSVWTIIYENEGLTKTLNDIQFKELLIGATKLSIIGVPICCVLAGAAIYFLR